MRNRLIVFTTLLLLATFGAFMRGQNPGGGYSSPATGGVCSNCITTNPTGTNQTIQAGDTTSIPLTIKEVSGTTATEDFQILNSGGTLVFGFSPSGAITTTGSSLSGWGGNIFTIGNSTGLIKMGTRTFQVGNDQFTHITMNQANEDWAGKLTCATSTVTKTFALAYTSTPNVIVFDETTKGGANLTAISNSAFTVSCTGATDALDYIVIGNPN